MDDRMKGKLNKQQLIELLDSISPPNADALSEAEFDGVVATFCAGCPDPVRAQWLLFECLDPLTDEELVERALRCPPTGATGCDNAR